jgi:hypothetical protein
MHRRTIVAFDKVGLPAVASEKLLQLLMLNAGKNRRIADLVSVQVEDRQDRAVASWIQ